MKLLSCLTCCIAIGCITGTIAAEKTLTVGVEASRAPFVYLDDANEVSGFEVDLLRDIAQSNGFEVKFVNMPFDALLPSVLTEQVDVAVSCIAMTEERQQIVDFVGPYYMAGLAAMIRNEFSDRIKSSYDLTGRNICVVNGTTCEEFALSVKDSVLSKFDSEQESLSALKEGKCDLLVTDAPVIDYAYIKQNPGQFYRLKNNLTFEQFGIISSKLRPDLTDRIDKGLKALVANGRYDSLRNKWFRD